MAGKSLLIRERFGGFAIQHLLQQVIHLVHQAIHVIAWAIPLQHGELRVVMAARLFVAEALAHLIDRTTARRQQALHVIFRAGHQIERHAIGRARPDKAGFERHQMDVRDGRLAHGRGFYF